MAGVGGGKEGGEKRKEAAGTRLVRCRWTIERGGGGGEREKGRGTRVGKTSPAPKGGEKRGKGGEGKKGKRGKEKKKKGEDSFAYTKKGEKGGPFPLST